MTLRVDLSDCRACISGRGCALANSTLEAGLDISGDVFESCLTCITSRACTRRVLRYVLCWGSDRLGKILGSISEPQSWDRFHQIELASTMQMPDDARLHLPRRQYFGTVAAASSTYALHVLRQHVKGGEFK